LVDSGSILNTLRGAIVERFPTGYLHTILVEIVKFIEMV